MTTNSQLPRINHDLLTKDTMYIMEYAIIFSHDLDIEFIMPEMIMVAILYRHDCAAARWLHSAQKKLPGLKISVLEEQFLELAQNQASISPAKFYYESFDNNSSQFSRESVILLDEALTIANSQHEYRIDTDHMLIALLQLNLPGSELLEEIGATAEFLNELNASESIGIFDYFG